MFAKPIGIETKKKTLFALSMKIIVHYFKDQNVN